MKRPLKNPGIAFFDLDGTLLDGYSAAFFLARRHCGFGPGWSERLKQLTSVIRHATGQTDFAAALSELALGLRGVPQSEMQALAEQVFSRDLLGRIYPEARTLIRAHQSRNETVVIISSATQFQVEPISAELGVQNVLCTQLAVSAGKLTGMLAGPPCFAEGKLQRAREFCSQHAAELADCTFYSDGSEDLPLLEAVGHPRPTNPDSRLAAVADKRGWPVQRFQPRGWPGWRDVARTGLVYGSLLPAFLLASPLGALTGSKRTVSNLGFSLWGEFGSAVAGLELDVTGEQNLWSHRPAVFVFNHQSAVDALIIARLLKRDFSGLAKRELQANPLLGPALKFADVVFIDRQQKGSAAIQPAVEKLQSGISITVAPEGHRSTGYRLGSFRKGAFLIAMQAGVPVIPIVIANAADALPRSATCIRPARVLVKVLKPISTRGWTMGNLDQKVAACRKLFLRTLGQWPESPP
jgi:putative phosphoserine phosphatase/1-acylglycerol-3-phosphate O-acyltransferase